MAGKVAFIADQIAHWNAGTERQMLLLGRGLTTAGWTVPLIVLRPSEASDDHRWPGEVTDTGIGSLASPGAWVEALRLALRLRRKGFRVAQLFFNDTSVLLPPFLRLCGIKVVIARRDMGFWYTPGQLRVLRFVRRAVSRVIANSRAVARRVCESEGFDSRDVEVIYNGLEDDLIREAADVQTARDPIVGLVANVRPVKRVDDAVKAFAAIANDHQSAQLRVIGGGDPTALRALADDLGVTGRVVFTGRVAQPANEIAQFSMGLLTSESEGFSNAIMEYMVAGKPVICTDTGGNPELVEHGVNGFLCPVGDTEGMARCLGELLSDPEMRLQMGRRARQKVLSLCNRALMVERHAAVYEDLTGPPVRQDDAHPVPKKS